MTIEGTFDPDKPGMGSFEKKDREALAQEKIEDSRKHEFSLDEIPNKTKNQEGKTFRVRTQSLQDSEAVFHLLRNYYPQASTSRDTSEAGSRTSATLIVSGFMTQDDLDHALHSLFDDYEEEQQRLRSLERDTHSLNTVTKKKKAR